MISRAAEQTQINTRNEALRILKHDPYISKSHLEKQIRHKNGSASSGTVSRIYNKHRREL